MAFSDIANSVSSIAGNVGSSLGKLGILTSSDPTNSEIRDRYTGGFLGDTGQFQPSIFSRLFDEPTYLTFRIEFNFDPYKIENLANPAHDGIDLRESYNYMPEPLLAIDKNNYKATASYTPSEKPVLKMSQSYTGANAMQSMNFTNPELFTPSLNMGGNSTGSLLGSNKNETLEEMWDRLYKEQEEANKQGAIDFASDVNNRFIIGVDKTSRYYSTEKYLSAALGESYRAKMLFFFKKALHDIQYNYPYYFTSVSGLNTLSMVNPEKGIRLDSDNNTITISCMEGLDMKITQLMQLYKKIAWDDVYQRWILPDMMRYFELNIYVSEIRLFHSRSRVGSSKQHGKIYDIEKTLNATSREEADSLMTALNGFLNKAAGFASNLLGASNGITKVLNNVNMGVDTLSTVFNALRGSSKMCNNAINDVMPTIKYECHMCEFDISDTISHISELSSSKEGLSTPTPEIKIKVGRLNEVQMYPLRSDLRNDGNKYSIKDSNGIDATIFSDYFLQETNTVIGSDYYPINDATIITRRGRRINSVYDGKTSWSAPATSRPELDNEAYDPLSSDKKTALFGLIGSAANFFLTDHDASEATNGDAHEKLSDYASSKHAEQKNINPYASVALSKEAANKVPKKEPDKNPYYSEAIENNPSVEQIISNEEQNIYKSAAVDRDSENNTNVDSANDYSSTATQEKQGKPTTVLNEPLEELYKSTAAGSQERAIVSIIDETSAESVLSAATSIERTIKYIEDNEVIKSAATDKETIRLLKLHSMVSVLDNLASSTATDKDSLAVKKLAALALTRFASREKFSSTATTLSNEERNRIKRGFDFLN
jgi:hypothetical protein